MNRSFQPGVLPLPPSLCVSSPPVSSPPPPFLHPQRMSPVFPYAFHSAVTSSSCLSPPPLMPSMAMDTGDYSSDDNEPETLYTPLQEQGYSDLQGHSGHKPDQADSLAHLSNARHLPQHLLEAHDPHASGSKYQNINVPNISRALSPFSPVFCPSVQDDPSGNHKHTTLPPNPDVEPSNYTLASFDVASGSNMPVSASNIPHAPPHMPNTQSLYYLAEPPVPLHERSSTSPSGVTGSRPRLFRPAVFERTYPTKGCLYSHRFPAEHHLNASFVQSYLLGDELGAGGYGFVMTAHHRLQDCEVAVKFIIKSKVPEHAWMEDKHGNRVPTEALLLGLLDHQNIVGCIDLFEDPLYFYLVSLSLVV